MKHFDVIIIGAGASGLMCAITAGQRGRNVLVLDHSRKPGSKILMSGGGRCNFTNLTIEADNFISANPHFCKSALSRYTQWDFIALINKHGIAYHERDHGQLFCDDSAKDVLKMLMDECHQAGVQVQAKCQVEKITHQKGYLLQTSQGEYSCKSLIIATGGPSIPSMGASRFGYEVAKQFGMNVLPTRAGLVPFMFSDSHKAFIEQLSGMALPATVSTNNRSFTEAILFTHRGLSGPAILQLSNYWHPGDEITINLTPEVNIQQELLSLKQGHPKSLIRNLLTEYLPRKLLIAIEEMYWKAVSNKPIGEISDQTLTEIALSISQWHLKPSATEGYRTAEVALGGVDTAGLSSKTMESKKQPGLYFIGEVVDVTGHLGGYNFQWAWSSGYAAGKYV